MREPFTKLYVHLVWATWDRAPIITADLLATIERAVLRECAGMGVEVIAFGGVADHVHLLVRYPARLSVTELVKQVKGATSHLINHRMKIPFKWQGGYGAFSISHTVLSRAREYVLNQERHHQYGTAISAAELPTAFPGAPDQD